MEFSLIIKRTYGPCAGPHAFLTYIITIQYEMQKGSGRFGVRQPVHPAVRRYHSTARGKWQASIQYLVQLGDDALDQT